MSTVLLIDGDILAYVAASAAERTVDNPSPDSFGFMCRFASIPEACQRLDSDIDRLMKGLEADYCMIALTDRTNWRHTVMPTYKSNRDETIRPIILTALKNHLRAAHEAVSCAHLEADDLVGIWATSKHLHLRGDPARRVCVTKDKDFQGIPGLHYTLGDPDYRVRTITEWDAVKFHLVQTLAGDRVDGYGGCPGLGMERARTIIENPQRLVPRHGIKTSGKNKGDPVTRWFAEPTDDYWACIVSHYQKAGLTEDDALLTARVAKILWADEFDSEDGTVDLWTPGRIRTYATPDA